SSVPCSEVASRFQCGLVYSSEDPASLGRSLRRLWTDADLRARLAAGALVASRELTWDRLMPRILDPVEKALSRRGRGASRQTRRFLD
ncbi:MAG: hypothetical protein L3J96_03465, partial [Thermoplasmata archaeon]|nr:hypothetical protein [Thermoplasmata archaeon]